MKKDKDKLETINKHGLSRTIPPDIKQKIRKNDGYGCVICGHMLVDYEHIDPLFCDATEHNPEHMTLLCSFHHDQVTRKVLPKRIIKKHKESPYCKSNGFAHSQYFPNPENIKIRCGSSYFENTKIILEIDGKPIIWIDQEEDSVLFNAIFYDDLGNKLGFLNKNTFIALINDCDILCIGSRIEARLKKGNINLILNMEGDNIVELERLNANYGQTNVKIDNQGKMHLKSYGSCLTIDKMQAFSCGTGINLGNKLKQNTNFTRLKQINKELIKTKLPMIKDISFETKGYVYCNEIIDLSGYTVAYKNGKAIYNLKHEYIGDLIKIENDNSYFLGLENDEYSDKEPIYITKKNKIMNKISKKQIFDISYRL
jgi:hypothetical protein